LAHAADTPPPGPMPHAEKDIDLAPAGTYALDIRHTAIIARVSHLGFSHLVFRFDRASGSMSWDPKNVARTSLTATVETGSIVSNVENFAAQLSGPKFLNVVAFPQATFVSTAFRQTDATHGKVDGTFTLFGQSRPATFDVSLEGAGPFYGNTVIGIHAETSINAKDYEMTALSDYPIDLVIDSEFDKKP
jgi:polyisoprenoid-binding protein YceI